MWLRIVAWRVSRSTTASTGTSSGPSFAGSLDLDHLVAADPVDVDHPASSPPGQRSTPESATWPPPSA